MYIPAKISPQREYTSIMEAPLVPLEHPGSTAFCSTQPVGLHNAESMQIN